MDVKCEYCGKRIIVWENWAYKNKNNTTGVYRYFCRYNHMIAWEKAQESQALHRRKKTHTPCRCVETGEVYPSLAAAARQIGADPESVRNSCARGHAAKGLHFQFSEEPE